MGKAIKDNIKFIITVILCMLTLLGWSVGYGTNQNQIQTNKEQIIENEHNNRDDHDKILCGIEKTQELARQNGTSIEVIKAQNKLILKRLGE